MGKVLVILLVFRSKLAFDRLWQGLVAIGDLNGACQMIVTDISVFFDGASDEQAKCRQDLYRLVLGAYMCMLIHIRKEADDLMQLHNVIEHDDTGNASWVSPGDVKHLRELADAGIFTEEEHTLR